MRPIRLVVTGAVAAGALALAGPSLGADSVTAVLPAELVAGTQFTLTLSSATDEAPAQYSVLGRPDGGQPCDPTSQGFRSASNPATLVTLVNALSRSGSSTSATATAPRYAGQLQVCTYLERTPPVASSALAALPQTVPVRLPRVTARAVVSSPALRFRQSFEIVVTGLSETEGRAVSTLQAAPCASSPPSGSRSSTVLAGTFSLRLRELAEATATPAPRLACVWITASGLSEPTVVFRAALPLTLGYDATLALRGGRVIRPRSGQLRGRYVLELTGAVTDGTVGSAAPRIRSGPRCRLPLATQRRGPALVARCVLAGRPGSDLRAAIAYRTRLGVARQTGARRIAAP